MKMNKHERLILEKLAEDPMLTQSELAEMLNITRSSVSVYISYLLQKGYIRGRGYVLADQPEICVVGSAGVDYQTVMAEDQMYTPLALDDYDLSVHFGGISKNICESLVRLGRQVLCISAVGSDLLGQSLLEECRSVGVDTRDFLIVPSERTSTYLEIRTPDFDKIILASANMKLQRRITPDFLRTKQHKLRRAALVVAEDSLSCEALQYLSASYANTLLLCTKPTRVGRYRDFLNQFCGMVTSLENAAAILDCPPPASGDAKGVLRLAKRLQSRLSGPLLLCYGEADFCYADRDSCTLCAFSDPGPRCSLFSHYRDTVAAGFLAAYLDGAGPQQLLKTVSSCRAIAALSKTFSCEQLCTALIDQVAAKKQFEFFTG